VTLHDAREQGGFANLPGDIEMQGSALVGPLKILSWVVVALMASAMLYAGFMVLKYWADITV
jgi:hypothetical protein